MRYSLVKPLRQRFTRELRRALPHFRERKARSGVRGTFLYEWRATPELTCYVALVIDDARDRFTVELAWSRSHHFPAQLRAHRADEHPRAGATRFHLRALWQAYRVEPSWSLVGRTPYETELDRMLIDPELPDGAKLALLDEHERRLRAAASEPEGELASADETPVTEALQRIGPAVDDVITRLRRYALPYFAGIVEEYGGGERAATSSTLTAVIVPDDAGASLADDGA